MPTPQEVERAREWRRDWMVQHRELAVVTQVHEPEIMLKPEWLDEMLADYHAASCAEERRRRQDGKTHWPGCWKDHLDCAVENVQRLVKAATEVERISSRDHNAWAELREALAPFKEEK